MFNKTECDFATGVYRCRDPIKNFKVRIRLRQEKSSFIPLPEFQQDHGDTELPLQAGLEDGELEERTFSWQEKCFSPYEISQYQHSANCHTALEEKYHIDVKELCQENIPNNRLFSKTDADDFTEMEEINIITTDTKPTVTPLVEGFSELRRRQKFGNHRKSRSKHSDCPKRDIIDYAPTEEVKKRNHLIESFPQVMYLMADLSIKDSESDEIWYGKSEYVLCTIRYDLASRVLSITPDLSRSAAEGPSEPYRIEVDGDARNSYLYWIDHVSVDIGGDELDREQEVMNKLYAHRNGIRQLQVGGEFKAARSGVLNVQVLGELRCASHFDYDHLLVHYFLELPSGWSCDESEHLSGVTQRCRTRRTGVAHFAHLFETLLTLNLDALHDNSDSLLRWPQLFLEVLSLDTWGRYRTEGYGCVNLPTTPGPHDLKVTTWRLLSDDRLSEMRRFFTGGCPELEDVSYAGIPINFQGTMLSKYGLRTMTSGDVHLRLDILHQCQAFVVSGDSAHSKPSANRQATFLLERLSAATLVNSVNATLKAYKRARERMLKSMEGLES